ncbi:MAG: ATP-dependent DNA helicase RecG [Planctomycetaceae bacterium]
MRQDDPLLQPVQNLTGIRGDRAVLLKKLGIETVSDLLWHLPRDLLDLTVVRKPHDLAEQKEEQTVRGTVVDMDAKTTRRGSLVAGLLDCDGEYVRGIWFNQPWMMRRLLLGHNVLFSGKPKRGSGARWEFSHPRIQWLEEDDNMSHGGLLAKYPLTEGLRMEEMRRLMAIALEEAGHLIPEHLPDSLLKQLELPRLEEAIHQVHRPVTIAQYQSALRRILFDDLFEFQLGLALRRRAWRFDASAPVLPTSAKVNARILRLFPFRLTAGQDRVIHEVVADLESGHAMHRLLQADVGAGKTVIAIYAMLVAVAAGFQAVLMAPTELLAQQHWETIETILAQSQVHRVLLTGSITPAQRREALADIASGKGQLIVGTQAIIQESVQFARLGVVVIDEQHKFGVAQRAKFTTGAERPHVLVMTATPIPRSLCLTQFGDLDLSLMDELPPGRQTIVTSRITGMGARRKAWEFLQKNLALGRQAYVVCPRVEADADTPPDASAVEAHRVLSTREFREFRVGLVHGQMDRQERTATMDRFREGELDVLISTTVIEVGVDVPNATMMAIMHADRFGLSQLHQLRGRVGRGKHQGYCFLFSETSTEDGLARLSAMERTANGFEIAEQDFQLRGPGDVLGTRQHGDMPLRVADLVKDADILKQAREVAFALVDSGEFDSSDYAMTKIRVLERFGQLMELPQSG